jgi:replicative DNA helicase
MPQKNDAFSERVPPQDLAAEQSVLGACLIDKDALPKVRPVLRLDDFYAARHGEVWAAICKAADAGPVDLITVQRHLPRLAGSDEWLTPLTNLVNLVPSTVNVESYAASVANTAKLRRIQTQARAVVDACYAADDPAQVLGDLQQAIDQEARGATRMRLKSIAGEIGPYAKQRFQNRKLPNSDWIPSRFAELRSKCPYLRREFTIVATPSGEGKTTLAVAEADFLAQLGYQVAFFELEMAKAQVFDKQIALNARLPLKDIRMGLLTDMQWVVYNEIGQRLNALTNLHLNSETTETMSNIRWQCLRMKAEGGLDMVVIDFIERVAENREKDERYDQLLARLAGIAQSIARECDCHVMVLAQVDVKVMERANPVPGKADLANSKTNLSAWPDNIITGLQPSHARGDGKTKPKIWGIECADKRWHNVLLLSIAKGRFSEPNAMVLLYAEMSTGFIGSLQRPWPWQAKCLLPGDKGKDKKNCPTEQKDCPQGSTCPVFQMGKWDKEADDQHLELMKAFRELAVRPQSQAVDGF